MFMFQFAIMKLTGKLKMERKKDIKNQFDLPYPEGEIIIYSRKTKSFWFVSSFLVSIYDILTFYIISDTRSMCFTISHIALKNLFENFPAKSAFISDGVKISKEEISNHGSFGSLKTIRTTLMINKANKLQVRSK